MPRNPYADLLGDLAAPSAAAPLAQPSSLQNPYADLLGDGPTAAPEPDSLFSKYAAPALQTVGHVLGAPKRGVDWLANVSPLAPEPLRERVLAGEEPIPTGELVANALLPAEEAKDSYAKSIGRVGLRLGTDLATDPLVGALGVAGKVAQTGRAGQAALGAAARGFELAPEAAALAEEAAQAGRLAHNIGRGAAAAFAPQMAMGAAQQIPAAYETYTREGLTPQVVEQGLEGLASAGFALGSGLHAGTGYGPIPGAAEVAARPEVQPVVPTPGARPPVLGTKPAPVFDSDFVSQETQPPTSQEPVGATNGAKAIPEAGPLQTQPGPTGDSTGPLERRVGEGRQELESILSGLPPEQAAVLRDKLRTLESESATDPLTGLLGNREWMRQRAEAVPGRRIVTADVKGFKAINDSVGHINADEGLKAIGSVFAKHFGQDKAFRPNGDEFHGFFDGVPEQEIPARIEALRQDVGSLSVNVRMPDGSTVALPRFELHIGSGENAEAADLAANADRQAHGSGRDQGPNLPPSGVARGPEGGGPDLAQQLERPAFPPVPPDAEQPVGGVKYAAKPMSYDEWVAAGRPAVKSEAPQEAPRTIEDEARPQREPHPIRYADDAERAFAQQMLASGRKGMLSLARGMGAKAGNLSDQQILDFLIAERRRNLAKMTPEQRAKNDALRAELAANRDRYYSPKFSTREVSSDVTPKGGPGDRAAEQKPQKPEGGEPASFPRAESRVGNLVVRKEVPNSDSIASSFNDGEYTVLPGVRKVPLALFDSSPNDLFYAADDIARTRKLAEQIRQSGEIDPLIIAYDNDASGRPYIVEGAHRLGALHLLGVKEFPALVVDARTRAAEPEGTPGGGVPPAKLKASPAEEPGVQSKEPSTDQPSVVDSLSPEARLTPQHVKSAFPSGKVLPRKDGTILVELPNGSKIEVRPNAEIVPDRATLLKDHPDAVDENGNLRPGMGITGAFQPLKRDGIIFLAKQGGDEPTLRHESFHAAMHIALSGKERAAVLKHFSEQARKSDPEFAGKSEAERIGIAEELAADAYAEWKPSQPNSYFGKILQFFRRIYRAFSPSWESAFERTESGEAYGKAALSDTGPKFATAPKPIKPIPEDNEPLGRPMRRDEAHRVDTKVENLKEVAPNVSLSRDSPRTWESLDPKIRTKLSDVLSTPEREASFYKKAQSGKLDDVEVQALDGLVRGKREAYDSIRQDLLKAQMEGRDTGPGNVRYLKAALDQVTAELATAARSDVEAGTKLARALAARARVMDAVGDGTPDVHYAMKRALSIIHEAIDNNWAEVIRRMKDAGELKVMCD